jgi:hypothetical protein
MLSSHLNNRQHFGYVTLSEMCQSKDSEITGGDQSQKLFKWNNLKRQQTSIA